jgi:ketosteroid isomerase-like protein
MSNENAELAYLAVDAFNRRDLDALLELVDPEVEFTRSRRRWGAAASIRPRGARRWWENLLIVFPRLQRGECGRTWTELV